MRVVGWVTRPTRLASSEMVTEGCTPDTISYSTLIKGFCHAGDLNAAMEHFMLMKRKEIVPDAIVFNSLLDGCAKSDMLTLCEELIQECWGSCGRSCGHAQCFMSDWRTAWAS